MFIIFLYVKEYISYDNGNFKNVKKFFFMRRYTNLIN